jgi:ubiquinone/menaquinone biosynthesis C-methylase UbiE
MAEKRSINPDYRKIIHGIKYTYDIACQEYFDLFHDDIYQHAFDQRLLNDFVSSFRLKPIVCDMGCGPAAQYGAFIAESCKEMHAVDISENNIKIARQNHPNITYTCEDMIDTHYADEFFDGIISFYSLFHIPKPQTIDVLTEFNRLLKSSGRLLIVTHKGKLQDTIREIWSHQNLELYVNFHSEEEIEHALKDTDFTKIEVSAKEAYYDFPKERIIATCSKR